MCDHDNMLVTVQMNSTTSAFRGKVSAHADVSIIRAHVVCTECGKAVFYEPTPSMPASRVREKAIAWFDLASDNGTAKAWLDTLELTVARIERKLELDLTRKERQRLEEMLQQHQEEIEQVKNLIIMQEAK